MDLGPLSDEISKRLRLDRRPASKFNSVGSELNGYMESLETRFVFGGVVGGQKVYLENVSELILGRRNE